MSDFEVFDFLRELKESRDSKDTKSKDKRDKGKEKKDEETGELASVDYQVGFTRKVPKRAGVSDAKDFPLDDSDHSSESTLLDDHVHNKVKHKSCRFWSVSKSWSSARWKNCSCSTTDHNRWWISLSSSKTLKGGSQRTISTSCCRLWKRSCPTKLRHEQSLVANEYLSILYQYYFLCRFLFNINFSDALLLSGRAHVNSFALLPGHDEPPSSTTFTCK